jgi:predicted Zn-dependent protease
MNKRKNPVVAIFLLSLTLLGGVAGSGCGKARFPNMISKSQEIEIGRDAAVQVERENRIITSGPEYDRLQRVAARIIPQAKQDYDVDYTVKLIDSMDVNAFALPGGPIYFYKGLVELAATDDELASVLGHEATHVVKRHSAKQISDAQAKSALAQIFLGRQSGAVQQIASLGLNIYQLRFSRDDEAQSDEGGFRYLTQAGYDPDAMASFFTRMAEKTGGGGSKKSEWLQSHPVTSSRIEKAQARAAEYKRNHP